MPVRLLLTPKTRGEGIIVITSYFLYCYKSELYKLYIYKYTIEDFLFVVNPRTAEHFAQHVNNSVSSLP
uniref:Uncharacterized protein n=1 Tax=Octopus bimaculoides TaxID=37653 RepID=A0A0L8G794_OCTBM